jgi:transmembrane sensor
MNKPNHIKYLLEKFKQQDLNALEAQELLSLVKKGDSNEALNKELEDLWLKLQETSVHVPSDRLLENLKNDIQGKPEQQSISFGKDKTIKLKIFLRYAAIFVLAVGVTWVTKDILNNKSTAHMVDNANTEVTVSYGSKSKVSLPDGSIVQLNSGSTLKYPAHFDRFSRNVSLEGEAFFDIKKDPKHPFFVKTKDITIKVLGTKFNVKSYGDEKTIQTTLITGTIEIYSNHSELTESKRLLVLKPNQQATFKRIEERPSLTDQQEKTDTPNLEINKPITINSAIDLTAFVAWKDNKLIFRDEHFNDLSRKLERWYDVEIEIKNDDLARAVFSGIFVKESIEQALNALKMATPFQYNMEKNHITIFK